MIQTKICSKCKIEKSIDIFFNCSKTKDGKLNHCKECCKLRIQKYAKSEKGKNILKIARQKYRKTAKYKKYDKSYRQTENCKLRMYNYTRTDEYKNKQKIIRTNNKEYCIYKQAKRRASLKNLDFTITIDDIIIPKICPVLGIPIIKNGEKGNENEWNSPSIDRINSNLGYIKNNICIISYKANVIKRDGTITEHEKIIDYMQNSKQYIENIKDYWTYNDNKEKIDYILAKCKTRSKTKNLSYQIDKTMLIIPKYCPILGIEIKIDNNVVNDSSPSLDRIDNTKGYTNDNICFISFKANSIKSFGTVEDHEKIIKYMKLNYTSLCE